MKPWKFWSSTFLIFFVLVWGFQNCSLDNFGSQGNGTPYEGISVDPNDPLGPEPPVEEDIHKDPPAGSNDGPGAGSPPASQFEIIEVEKFCVFRNSSLFANLSFGQNSSGKDIVKLKFADRTETALVLDSTMNRQIPMDYKHSSGNHIDLIIYGTDSASITYTDIENQIVTAMTSCQ